RLFTTQNAIHVTGSQAVLINFVRSITHQPAGRDKVAVRIDRRKSMACCKIDNQLPMNEGRHGWYQNQAAIRPLCECSDQALDLAGVANTERVHLHTERWRNALHCSQQADSARIGWIAKHSGTRYPRGDLLEEFQPFCTEAVFGSRKAGRMATGP